MGVLRAIRGNPRLGWKPNKPDADGLRFSALNLGEGKLRTERVLTVPEVFDQRNTSTCVAQSIAQAINVRERFVGLPLATPSRLGIYYDARKRKPHAALAWMFDNGTYIRSACAAVRANGVAPESAWPFSTSKLRINRQPPPTAYTFAYERRGLSYYHLDHFGQEKLYQLAAAIDAGHPVVTGMNVTTSFMRMDGPQVIDVPAPTERVEGGHAFLIVGKGAKGWLMVNSWSMAWRMNGHAWLTDDVVVEMCRDLTVVEGWQRLEAA